MSYEKELDFAKSLALEAGGIMKRYFRAEDIGTEWKKDNTPLTVADTQVNDLVIKKVKEYFPDHGVIGEENSFETKRNFVWVVDPIDGTVPFSLGMPISTFSIGLVDRSDGQSVLGVAYDPQLDRLYTSVRGCGAFLNDIRIKTAKNTDLERTYVSILSGLVKGDKDHSIFKPGHCLDIIRGQGANCFSVMSQVYFASRVASGELVGSIFGYGSPWDSAAVSLLVEEAGGIVTDLRGNKRRFDQFGDGCLLSANESIHLLLLDAVKRSTP